MTRPLIAILLLTLQACSPAPAPADLSALRGQWVAVNYWAVWCSPCIKEIPELNALDQHYAAVSVLGVNYDGVQGEALAAQERKLGIEFPNLDYDPAPELGQPRPQVLPTTFIIDPEGQVSEVLTGPQTLESLARATGQAAPE